MKFKNVTADTLVVPALGVEVEPGGLLDLGKGNDPSGIFLQTDVWEPADPEAQKATKQPADQGGTDTQSSEENN